ncbi:MAG: IS66 family transposase [Candidatus Hadarchaeum sp.]|uniref:IS66 family transposase n=1 Tax=Candidatus Hadarchaeum sp. TaxID=2883567 RepID=UPI003D10A9E2
MKRRLALYESVKVPLPRTRRRVVSRDTSEKRFPGKPKRSPGRTRPKPEPNVVIAPEWESCEKCGALLPPPEVVDHHIVEEISNPSPGEVIDYLELGGKCTACGTYNVAVHPDCPPVGRFGKNVYVQTTLHKFEERLPLARIGSVFERSGLKISAPTELELLWRMSNWLRPKYEEILSSVRSSRVVYTDQTGIKVDGTDFWIWDFVTELETLFVIRKRKSQKVLEEILGKDWDGTLVGDGLRSHHSYARKSGAKIQRCWAHLLREAKELGEKYEEARALSEGLHRIFDRLKKALEDDPPPEERAKLARTAMRAMRRLINKRYKSSRVRKFVEKMRRGYPFWFTFVTVPGVEPTNNRAERALRELVVQRKIIGTLRNEKGMQIYETLPTLLATWKQQGLSLQEELSNALTEAWQNMREKREKPRGVA